MCPFYTCKELLGSAKFCAMNLRNFSNNSASIKTNSIKKPQYK